MKSEIAELVLRGTLKDPFARGFDIAKWQRETTREGTDESEALLQSTLLIKKYIDALFAKLNTTLYKTSDRRHLADSLVLSANSIALDFHRRYLAQIKQDGKRQLSVLPRVMLAGQNEFSIADANTSLIDSLRLPLSTIIPELEVLNGWQLPHFIEDTEAVSAMLRLASAWHILKIFWQKCLFFGCRLSELDDTIRLESNFDFAYFVVGRARQMHDNMASYVARTYVRRMEELKAKPRARRRKDSKRDGIKLIFSPTKKPDEDDGPLDDFQRKFVLPAAIEPKVSGLTYRQLIRCFDLLGEFVGDSFDRIQLHRKPDLTMVLDIQCRFSTETLISSIGKSLRLDGATAQHAFRVLTYTGQGEFDPWSKPVIDMKDGTSVLLGGVLGPSNRSFVLDSFMKTLNFDLDPRGDAFEKFVESELREAAKQCPYGQIIKMSSAGIEVVSKGEREEIDLLLEVGRDLYVIECKCVMFPVELSHEYLFISRIKDAETQLERKVTFIRKSAEHLRSLHPSLRDFVSPIKVEGLILTTFQGGPASFCRFPISTPEFLVDYFINGKSMAELEAGRKGVVVHDESIVHHYGDFESFRKNFWKCQILQPHLLSFQKMLHRFKNNVWLEDLDLKPIIADEVEVVVPGDDRERQEALTTAAKELRAYLDR